MSLNSSKIPLAAGGASSFSPSSPALKPSDHPATNNFFQADEGPAADEQDVGGIDGSEFLVGMLTPPWGGTLAMVPSRIFSRACCTPSPETSRRSGRVLVFASDFVDFVDIDDAGLARPTSPSAACRSFKNNVLNVLADVTGLGQVVASTMAKGTSSMRARVWASRVLPVPVGPISMMFDLASSTPSPARWRFI